MDMGDFEGALTITNEIKKLGDNYYISYVVSGLLIDLGVILDENLTEEGINLLEKDKKEMLDGGLNAQSVYYNLANGYSNLFKVKSQENPYYSFFRDSELDTAIKYYRKSLEYGPPNPEIYVNLGNCFDSAGRVIDALDCYQNALNLDPKHAMALGNKGMALVRYAQISGEHEKTFLLEAYSLLTKSLDLGVLPESVDIFSNYLQTIKKNFRDEELDHLPKFPGYKIKSEFKPHNLFSRLLSILFPGYKIKSESAFEKYLINYCLENKLYLNVCNFCQKCDAAIGDTALIKQMTITISETENDLFLQLSAYLNQIKEDYVTARFLLIVSRYKKLNLNFVDKRVRITDTLDYSMYNVYIQLLKFAFKNLYDVLDKIAYFIKEYLELNFKETQIDFRRIWYEKGNKRIINEKIKNTKNLSLNALFKIHKDLEGPYKILKDIRNGITHRFIKIQMFCETENDRIMTEETLLKHTLQLTKIVRNAIIYLLQFVNTEEAKKTKEMKSSNILTGTLFAKDIPDNLKGDRHYINQ